MLRPSLTASFMPLEVSRERASSHAPGHASSKPAPLRWERKDTMPTPYESYVRAFARDLRQLAVWKPGAAVELGAYGELQNRQWICLGSIWDLLPDSVVAELKRHDVSASTSIRMDTSVASRVLAGAEALGKMRMGLTFSETHSVYFRASNCQTRSLVNIDAIVQRLWNLAPGRWRKSYRFVNEVSVAGSFVVLVGGQAGSQVTVSAESKELLSKFELGAIKGEAGIELTGDAAIQIVGECGPYGMTLVGIKAPWWKKDPALHVTRSLGGRRETVANEVSRDPWDPALFLKEFDSQTAPEG